MPAGPQGPNGTYLTAPMLSRPRIHHIHMARLVVMGCTPGEIAEVTGFSPVQITKILASPLFQKEVARLAGEADTSAIDLRQELQSLALKAMVNLEEDLHIADGIDPNELTNFQRRLRNSTSMDVLDRVGLGNKTAGSGVSLHLHKHEEQHVHAMSVDALRNDVMELLRGE